MNRILEGFAERAGERIGEPFSKAGTILPWVSILLPVILKLIELCLDNRDRLMQFAQSGPTPLQMAALRLRCRQEARANGASLLRSMTMGNAMADAIVAETVHTVSKSASAPGVDDIYDTVLAEVAEVSDWTGG